jgi:hypothetical protein
VVWLVCLALHWKGTFQLKESKTVRPIYLMQSHDLPGREGTAQGGNLREGRNQMATKKAKKATKTTKGLKNVKKLKKILPLGGSVGHGSV